MTSEFWLIICESLDETIESIKVAQDNPKLSALPPDQYKVENEILRTRRQNLEDLKNLPTILIQSLEQPDQSEPNLDPHYTAEDFEPGGSMYKKAH
mgnify:CR=1 FL=1